MRLSQHIVFAVLALAFVSFAQSRVDSFQLGDVNVQSVKLSPLPDGGCVAEWCGTVSSMDGSVQLYDCASRELANATNLTRCANMVNAGQAPLGRQLRLTLDGGSL